MRQPTTAELRLDEHKAASVGPAGPSILPFWPSTSRRRSNFVAAEPPGTEDRDQQLRYPGNVGLISHVLVECARAAFPRHRDGADTGGRGNKAAMNSFESG